MSNDPHKQFRSIAMLSAADSVQSNLAWARRKISKAWDEAEEAKSASCGREAALKRAEELIGEAVEALIKGRKTISDAMEAQRSISNRQKENR